MDRRKKERGRQPTAAGPTIALGDRAASSRGRRPETVEEKRKRLEAEVRRTAAARSKANWANMRRVGADTAAGHARRVREQQFMSAIQG